MNIFLKYCDFLNESENNEIVLYHGGDIEELDYTKNLCLSEDYYMAYSYSDSDDIVYVFKLSNSSKILDLVNSDNFKNTKCKIYDNYSEKYKKYKKPQLYRSSEESIDFVYNILKKFKNFKDIEKKYNEMLTTAVIQSIYSENIIEFNINLQKINRDFFDENKDLIEEFIVLNSVVRNTAIQNDFTINEFGNYFQDYCIENGYDGFKAISAFSDGVNKGVEYNIVNLKVLKYIETKNGRH